MTGKEPFTKFKALISSTPGKFLAQSFDTPGPTNKFRCSSPEIFLKNNSTLQPLPTVSWTWLAVSLPTPVSSVRLYVSDFNVFGNKCWFKLRCLKHLNITWRSLFLPTFHSPEPSISFNHLTYLYLALQPFILGVSDFIYCFGVFIYFFFYKSSLILQQSWGPYIFFHV